MAHSILDYPPELLVHILNFLPVQTLLRFGQTSRYSRSLANSSLHTLSLGIYPSRVSATISQLSATHYPQPKEVATAFLLPNRSTSSPPSEISNRNNRRSSLESDFLSEDKHEDDPYRVSVLIPDAQTYDYPTLLSFNTLLVKSVLTRHGGILRNLDLSLWTLTTPIARVISNLSALRALSIRIEDFPHVRTVPRSRLAMQRAEQRAAWDLLASTAVFAPRLHALRIEGGELRTTQLSRLLSKSRWCKELWLCKCSSIGEEVWSWLGSEWQGRTALCILGVMRCGGQLGEEALDTIGGLKNLQFLSLQGSYGIDSDIVERRNKEQWHIREVIPPSPPLEEQDGDMVIEVDPAYM
ncbi:hypothetical protein CC80DRAFT_545891 [Byssothecium circinans]|uniref:F-box domain-containing protein n=1 Tax=Byssothecium circinans TaxID=147558 RepID=A0A6A5U0V8_9PLEO|nr:hypothetical protein CC80DRAFT_545891 [Byssothecium circinans]